MKSFIIAWTLSKNLAALLLFWGILLSVEAGFQVVVVAGIGLIYSLIVHYCTTIIRVQLESAFSRTAQYIALHRAIDPGADLDAAKENLRSDKELVRSHNAERVINMTFNGIIWVTAVIVLIFQL